MDVCDWILLRVCSAQLKVISARYTLGVFLLKGRLDERIEGQAGSYPCRSRVTMHAQTLGPFCIAARSSEAAELEIYGGENDSE